MDEPLIYRPGSGEIQRGAIELPPASNAVPSTAIPVVSDLPQTFERVFTVFHCLLCGWLIGDTGLCSYQCANDDEYWSRRPKGSVLKRTYKVAETLISEEVL